MFGLVVWGGFLLWLYITFLAIRYGKNLGKDKGFEKLGAFCGFMLTMGVFIVYWMAEFIYIQAKVNHLCKTESGVTVYVTPEKWRKMIGEEEWNYLVKYDYIKKQYYPKEVFIYNGLTYNPVSSFNSRLVQYIHQKDISKFIGKTDSIIIDIKEKKQVMRYNYISAGSGSWLSGNGSSKFWLNYISSCNDNIKQDFEQKIQFYSKNQ